MGKRRGTKIADAGSSGRVMWAQKASGVSNNGASAVALGTNGQVYVAGQCGPSTSFGSTTFTGPVNTQTVYLATLYEATGLSAVSSSLAAGMTIFPNPAHGRATIQLPFISGAPAATLTLFNALGRTVRIQTAATSGRTELDLTGLVPGLYAVRTTAGAHATTRRLLVE